MLLLAIGVALTAAPVRAQEDDPRAEQAREAFERGESSYGEGRYALAAQSFRTAFDLLTEANHPRALMVLFNLGRALEELPGRQGDARAAYQRVLDDAPQTAEFADTRRRAEDGLRELDARAEPEGEDAVPIENTSSASEGGSVSPVGPVLLGVGGAAVLAGVITGGVGFAEGQDLLDRCPTETNCPGELRDDEDAARTLAIAGDVTWIAGAVIAATGLVLTFVLTQSGSGDERAELSLRSTPGGGLVTLQGGI